MKDEKELAPEVNGFFCVRFRDGHYLHSMNNIREMNVCIDGDGIDIFYFGEKPPAKIPRHKAADFINALSKYRAK